MVEIFGTSIESLLVPLALAFVGCRALEVSAAPRLKAHTRNTQDTTHNRNNHQVAAAEQRADPDMCFRLGLAYRHGGAGAAPDVAAAARWLREAARMGHPGAQSALGKLLLDELQRATGNAAPDSISLATAVSAIPCRRWK